jgi:hypothetical protein
MTKMPTADEARTRLTKEITVSVSKNTLCDFQARTLEAVADELVALADLNPRSEQYAAATNTAVDHLRHCAQQIRQGGAA